MKFFLLPLLLLVLSLPLAAQDLTALPRFLDRQLILLYALPETVTVDRVIIDNTKITDPARRASQIEVFITTIESNLEEDYISCGVFELPADEDRITCVFDPLAARYVRVKILASWGGENVQAGEIQIGRTGASLDGTVTDAESGQPLSGVRIELAGNETQSSDDGRFHFPHLGSGTHILLLSRSGYAPTVRELTIDSTRARQLDIGLRRSMTDLYGLVRDAEAQPLASVEITLRDPAVSTTSDRLGFFACERLKAGSTEIVFSREGYRSLRRELLITPGIPKRLDVSLQAGRDTEPPLPLKLSPFAYHPADPTRFGSPAQAIYLHFDEAVDRNALNLLNYRLRAWEQVSGETRLQPLAEGRVELIGVSLHRGDPGGRTVRLNLNYPQALRHMPFLELTVQGIGDEQGNRIPPPGRLVRNFSPTLYPFDPPGNGN